MPADSRTGIESRIVLRLVREVKTTGSRRPLDYGAGGWAGGTGVVDSTVEPRFVSVT